MITVERTLHGYLRLSTIAHGRLITQLYGGYTLRDAKAMFRAHVKGQA